MRRPIQQHKEGVGLARQGTQGCREGEPFCPFVGRISFGLLLCLILIDDPGWTTNQLHTRLRSCNAVHLSAGPLGCHEVLQPKKKVHVSAQSSSPEDCLVQGGKAKKTADLLDF